MEVEVELKTIWLGGNGGLEKCNITDLMHLKKSKIEGIAKLSICCCRNVLYMAKNISFDYRKVNT